MSRGVIISAISMRGGASRMSMPDGSRHRTSARSDSAIRSVGRSRIDGASTGTLRSARRSPNWRLPSIRTVRWPSWPSATARLNAIVVLPTPPLGAKTEMTRVRQRRGRSASSSLRTPGDAVHQVEARRTASPGRRGCRARDRPRPGSAGRSARSPGTPRPAAWICSTSLGPLIRPCSSASTSTTSGRSSPIWSIALAAVGEHVEHLDVLLGVQQAADVLRDLRARPRRSAGASGRCSTARHGPDDTTGPRRPDARSVGHARRLRGARRRGRPAPSPGRSAPRS